jgi:hypothetical protein
MHTPTDANRSDRGAALSLFFAGVLGVWGCAFVYTHGFFSHPKEVYTIAIPYRSRASARARSQEPIKVDQASAHAGHAQKGVDNSRHVV